MICTGKLTGKLPLQSSTQTKKLKMFQMELKSKW